MQRAETLWSQLQFEYSQVHGGSLLLAVDALSDPSRLIRMRWPSLLQHPNDRMQFVGAAEEQI